MMPLNGCTVLALGDMAGRPLCRFLESLGATVHAGVAEPGAVQQADFLVDGVGLDALASQGVTSAQLQQWNARLIHVSVSLFGSGGPRAHWRGDELIASAMGGVLRLVGDPDRPPVKEALDACTFHAEMVAACGAMAAHHSRQASGRGQHVDVSTQEVAFSRNVSGVLAWQFDQRKVQRSGGAVTFGPARVRYIWKLADGWCFHALMTGRFGAPANQALSDWMDECGCLNPLHGVDWQSYNRSTLPAETRATWEQAIDAFFVSRTREELRTEGRRRGINATVLEGPLDVLADAHLAARDFWIEQNGKREPRRFALLREAPAGAEEGAAVQSGERGSAAAGATRTGPLAGVRVLDFSWALVGSVTTKVLGDLGADVIKVESRTRPCLSRIDVQVSASRAGDFDDKPWFAHLNTSKRSLSLDLKRREAGEVLQPLLDWADVVVENFSPGTMEKLGLGYDTLAARRPALIMASGSVYGQTGPLSGEWGIDGTGAALSGRTLLTGWPDRDPVIPGAVPFGDVIVPYVMAACIAAALVQRRQHGRGCHIDAAMYEICVQQMRAAIENAQSGDMPRRRGNADPRLLQQLVCPAKGDDRWVAISLTSEAQQQKLAQLARGRSLEEWTATQEERSLVEQLQAEGIAAGMVQDIEDMLERDATLHARGALVELPHPRLGAFGHVRTPISFSGERIEPYRAPGMGEHNREILMQAAGLTAERYEALRDAGVLK
jgi:crotonobetainyl-CoA:carnitine CoA-transferase CaiB-like acyl-CoA transferase